MNDTVQDLRLEMAAGTDIGLIRTRNEDALRIIPENGFAILSDGMGGHRAGDVASRMAVEIVAQGLNRQAENGEGPVSTDLLVDCLGIANESIREVAEQEPDCHGMGATIVVMSLQGKDWIAAHLGDSRLYRFWNDELEQLTEDHTLARQYVREGIMNEAEADRWIGRNMLVKGLGIDTEVDPEINQGDLEADQLYLLCSDGLTDAVPDNGIAAILRSTQESLQETVDQLIELANQNGGPDNISVILIRTRGEES